MKVLVSGASGLVGSALVPELKKNGFDVRPLVRGDSGDSLWWNPATGEVNARALNSWAPDAMVHLAGENIASKRWSAHQKQRIRESRVEATQRLSKTLLSLEPPRTFISASAIGYYGNRGDEELTEASPPGDDFLATLTNDWEAAARPLQATGCRVVHLRFGMILSANGGALAKMLTPFKLGLGGPLGSGKQWISWVALTDVVRVIQWALTTATANGSYNVVSPNPVTNAEFTQTLAEYLRRPAIFRAPASMLRLVFGEMADALLLASERVLPQRLDSEGFDFNHQHLAEALRFEL